MFIPNNFGLLSRTNGRNIYGEPKFSTPKRVPCGIVNNKVSTEKTPVRADSSADRGAAEEEIAAAKILFPATVVIGKGDKFQIYDMTLRVIGVEIRVSIGGVIDHKEVDFAIWPS